MGKYKKKPTIEGEYNFFNYCFAKRPVKKKKYRKK